MAACSRCHFFTASPRPKTPFAASVLLLLLFEALRTRLIRIIIIINMTPLKRLSFRLVCNNK